mgnify:CR=1 FL=1
MKVRLIIKALRVLSFALMSLVLGVSCSTEQSSKQETYVVCTTNIIANVAREVLPQDIEVISLMGAGVDPHLYKAGHKDLEYLQNAKVIVENGLHLEGKMAEVLVKLQRYKTVIRMSDGMDERALIKISEDIYDPHIWFDLTLWADGALHVKNELVKIYPGWTEKLDANSSVRASI